MDSKMLGDNEWNDYVGNSISNDECMDNFVLPIPARNAAISVTS